MKDEFTAYQIPNKSMRWLEKWNPANEGLYAASSEDKILQQEWCYPALFNSVDKSCWYLLHEADLDRNYCGTKLSNTTRYKYLQTYFSRPKRRKRNRRIKSKYFTSLEIALEGN